VAGEEFIRQMKGFCESVGKQPLETAPVTLGIQSREGILCESDMTNEKCQKISRWPLKRSFWESQHSPFQNSPLR
jgi:hypothetical protein